MFRSTFLLAAFILAVWVGVVETSDAQGVSPTQVEEIDEFLARGMALHQAGDLFGAIQNYEIALETAPDRADIRSNLGAAYVALGRFAEAIDEYGKALASKDEPAIRLNLALALYKSGRTDAAVPELQQVLRKDPSNKPATLLLADCLLQAGRDRDVIELLTPSEAGFSDDLAYAYLLGTALLRDGQTQRGEVMIDRIFRKGDSAEGHVLMGLAHLNKRDYPNAIAELARAIALNPALPSAQVLYGRALLGALDRDHAMRVFRTALEQEPTNFDANLQLGTLYRIEQRFDDAMLYLRRAASVKPDDVGLRHSMAATQLGLGDVQKARELLEGVTRDAPGFVDAHVLLATAYYRLKRKDEGDRERAIIERLTAEKQASQPGAKREEVERESGSDDPGSPPRRPKS